MTTVFIKNNNNYSTVSSFSKKVSGIWTSITQEEFLEYLNQRLTIYGGNIQTDRFEIAAPNTIIAESCQCLVSFNGYVLTTDVQWTITSGSAYASIDNTGLLTILTTANKSDIVIQASYGNFSATHNIKITYKSGSTSESNIETVIDESGNTVITTTTITTNSDGTESTQSTSITYNSSGEATEKVNEEIDINGNVSTQDIEFDEDGNEVVVGYSIDTSDNPGGSKQFNSDGVDTDYYAFDLTHGFELNIHFRFNETQPPNQNENHHNILTMKRANPSPWYGFQLRHSNTNTAIILGTQFSSGSNTNTNIVIPSDRIFNLRITYNPLATTNSFTCYDVKNSKYIYRSNNKFPDLPELHYLSVTLGCALDENGQPYRYSNINIYDFSITRT